MPHRLTRFLSIAIFLGFLLLSGFLHPAAAGTKLYVKDGNDLAGLMVRGGWAIDYGYFSHGFYAAAQDQAQIGKRGIWGLILQRYRIFHRIYPKLFLSKGLSRYCYPHF